MLASVLHTRYRLSRKLRTLRNRLFHPNRLSFPAVSAEAVASLSQQALPVTMVTSFPRSGNTWMRMMLTDIFAELGPTNLPDGDSRNTWIDSHNMIPDIYFDSIEGRDPSMHAGSAIAERFGVFIKTHETFEQLDRIKSWNRDNVRHLYLFRAPEDSLVSFYHFHCRPSGNQKLTVGGIDRFCLEHLSDWKAMTQSYLDLAMRSASRVHFVAYENMLSEPEKNLARCFDWFGEAIDPKVISEAVERNRFENARKSESTQHQNQNHNVFRRGTSGAGKEELSMKTLTRIQSETSDLMVQAKARIASKPRLMSAEQTKAA